MAIKNSEVLKIQEYRISAEYDEKVTIVTTVYHVNEARLSVEEIIKETKEYFEDAGLTLHHLGDSDYIIEELH